MIRLTPVRSIEYMIHNFVIDVSIILINQFSLTEIPLPGVGVLDRWVLNQLVNLYCVFPVPDGDTKRHKDYTGSGNSSPTSSLRDRSCIPCTEMLVVGGYKLGERESQSQVSARCDMGCLRRCSQAAGKGVCYRALFFVSACLPRNSPSPSLL